MLGLRACATTPSLHSIHCLGTGLLPTFLSGAGPVLYPGVSHAPGSSLGNNHHADLRYEASLGAACCSPGTGWVTSPWTDVFSCQKDPSASTQRAYHILSTWGFESSSVCLKYS